MKKLWFLILAFFLTACSSSCSKRETLTHYEGYPDSDATQAQQLINHAVRIRIMILGLPRIPDPSKRLDIYLNNWVGSGSILAVKQGAEPKSLILTAAHVCETPIQAIHEERLYNIVNTDISIYSTSDSRAKGRILWQNKLSDVCLIEAAGLLGTPVKLAESDPPVGGKLQNPGFPLSVWSEKHFCSLNEGRVIGFKYFRGSLRLYVTIPSVLGQSGSGVFYRGRLVGMVVATHVGFHHLSLSSTLFQIKMGLRHLKGDWAEVLREKE